MAQAIFDTLAFAKKLESKGVPVEQAEAHAEYLKEVLETTISPVISLQQETKKESSDFGARIDKGFAEIKEDLAKLEIRLIKWMVGLVITFGAFVYGALKFMH